MCPLADSTMLSIDAEWDSMCDIIDNEEILPTSSSSKAVNKVLEEWTTDEESISDDEDVDMEIMEVDEEIGSNFLSDEIFGHCASPVTPQGEFSMNIDRIDDWKFLAPPLTSELPAPQEVSPFIDARYREAYLKLAESMKRTQESRSCLNLKTEKATAEYERRPSIDHIILSIEKSTEQLRNTFGIVQCI
jgi:hypothetical protein